MAMEGAEAIGLVCFDLGGVVLRICRSWMEGCQAAGLGWRGSMDPLRAGFSGLDALNEAHQTGRVDGAEYARRFSELIGGLYSPEEVTRVLRAWVLGEYEGMAEVVDGIHEAGLETAVLSNTSEGHWETFPKYGAFCRLRNRLGSHELGVRKPDARAYRAVEDLSGYRRGAILFFDDLAENVEGARAVGWDAQQVDPQEDTAAQVVCALRSRGIALERGGRGAIT